MLNSIKMNLRTFNYIKINYNEIKIIIYADNISKTKKDNYSIL